MFDKFEPELNITYLVRLHWNGPKMKTGKYGDFYYTTIDLWMADGQVDDAVLAMINSYAKGSPPRTKSWTLATSFVQMWTEIGLEKNDAFLVKKKNHRNVKKNKDFPYYEIRILTGKLKDKTFSTMEFRGLLPVDSSINRDIPNFDGENIPPEDTPDEFKLLVVNPDVYILTLDCFRKVDLLCKDMELTDIQDPERVIMARHFYFETLKKGWTTRLSSSGKSGSPPPDQST